MGMIGNLLRVTQAELDSYLKDSSLLEKSVYNDDTDEENPKLTDIDKSWDGIIFLLTGNGFADDSHPLVRVLFSGQIIDEDQDLGYGPAHYLTPAQVAELNTQLAAITVADLKQKYDPQKMTALEIYPNVWDEGEEAFSYLSEYFVTVQKEYAEAAKNGEGIITFIN